MLKKIFKKLIKGVNNPKSTLIYILGFKVFRVIPDSTFLKIKYRLMMREKLNLNSPEKFNEKLQWLKQYDRKPEYTMMVDKYEVRKYITKKIDEEYLIPLLGVWESFEDIDFEKLPNQFVLKPNHTSGNVYICKDKSEINYDELKKEVNSWIKREYYWIHREWPYKNIKARIICEKYMVDESGTELKDYKIMCFNGEPKVIQVMSGRKNNQFYINHYDIKWNRLDIIRKSHEENPKTIKRPSVLDEMLKVSKNLSKNIPFLRVDLYLINNKVFFGEMTFFPVSGYMDFKDLEDDLLLGSWIKLPIV